MVKISLIGAGSFVFAKKVVSDILSFPELRESEIVLMDVDPERLKIISEWVKRIVSLNKFPTKISSTLERKKALKGADFVVCMLDVGGLKARTLDIEVPLKYGIPQAIGDTLGPGGIFKGLRLIPSLLEIAHDMEKICPEAFLFNYTNPMAINCWAINKETSVKCVGFCHGLEHTKMHLSDILNVPYEEISTFAAGINHMTWLLTIKHKQKDLYPLLKEKVKNPKVFSLDPIRFELMKMTGYFVTETSYHTAEYLPYFRDRFSDLEVIREEEKGNFPPKRIKKSMGDWKDGIHILSSEKGETSQKVPIAWDVKGHKLLTSQYFEKIKKEIKSPSLSSPSVEYVPKIIHSICTGKTRKVSANFPNHFLIDSLLYGCTVEVPALVDKEGIHPIKVEEFPPICASLNRLNINVQELVVEAATKRKKECVYQAMLLDPLTNSILLPFQISKLTEEMFSSQKEWIKLE